MNKPTFETQGFPIGRSACFWLLLFWIIAPWGWAQEYRGSINGRIVDPQQKVIPGVTITLTEINTGAKFETVSSGDGQFTVPFLLPGRYKVEVEQTGFKHYVREGVRVSTNDRVSVDIVLELGGSNETVTVSADAPLVNTSNASTGQVINSRQVEDMPLMGRAPYALAQLSYGVTPRGTNALTRPFDNGANADFSIGGAPNRGNELLLDGQPNISEDGSMGWSPPVDALQEVKVETFQSDASYGHTGGGTINAVTKAGTNKYHGTLYEFNQVSALQAASFFNNRVGRKKPVTSWNQYGATIGGPVVIPKLFRGQNKLLFFFAFEGIKNKSPEEGFVTVPTMEQRRGDFSKLLALGNNYQLYNPFTGVVSGTRVQRQPFPGNIIPQNLISPVATKMLPFWGEPNVPGSVDGTNNYYYSGKGIDDFDSELGRLDYNISDRNKLSYNFRHNDRLLTTGNRFNTPSTGYHLNEINWGSSLDHVYTLTPTTVLNTRFNWNRKTELRTQMGDGTDYLAQMGFPTNVVNAATRKMFPGVSVSGYETFGYDSGRTQRYDNFQIFSTLNKVWGKHMVKIGTDLRQQNYGRYQWGQGAGSYSVSTDWIRGPYNNSAAPPMGGGMASLLLGTLTGGSFVAPPAQSSQSRYLSVFVQDDFRLNNSLTLNLGLRYEREFAPTERYNRILRGFDPVVASPISAPALAAYTKNPIPEVPVSQFKTVGGLLFADSSNRSPYDTSAKNFSPRLGFAWKPAGMGGKNVLRGGLGLFYTPNEFGGTAIDQTGFTSSTPIVSTLDGGLTPAATLANIFPTGFLPATGSSLGISQNLGQGASYYIPLVKNGYAIRWNLDVQRELPWDMVLQMGYQGNHAVHLMNSYSQNFVPAKYLSTSPARDQATIDYLAANVTNPFAGLLPGTNLNGSTVSRSQLLYAYPQYTGVTRRFVPEGSSVFHMFQARIEKRFSNGLQFLGNFQRSKMITRTSRLNNADLQMEKVIANEDRPQRIAVSGSYDLPFGKGKPFAAHAGRGWDAVLGGWAVNFIYQQLSGPPLSWGNIIRYGTDIKLNPRNIDQAFDTTMFNRNSSQQLASNLRTFPSRFSNLRQDGQNNWDFSILKNTRITESLKLQFRGEFFNAFNHVLFGAPDTSPTSGSFGKITSQINTPRYIQLGLKLIF